MKYAWFMFVYVCTVEPHICMYVREYECREEHKLIKLSRSGEV